jgi:hypothetical protein
LGCKVSGYYDLQLAYSGEWQRLQRRREVKENMRRILREREEKDRGE